MVPNLFSWASMRSSSVDLVLTDALIVIARFPAVFVVARLLPPMPTKVRMRPKVPFPAKCHLVFRSLFGLREI
jgi:hypothetical protein